MSNLIRGDIRRIVRKGSMWVFFIIAVLYNAANVIYVLKNKLSTSYMFMNANASFLVEGCGLLVGIGVFLAVYGDEFRTMTITTVIGAGYSRLKVIISKFIDSIILIVGFFILSALSVPVLAKMTGITMSSEEIRIVMLSLLIGIYYTIGCVVIASIAIYLSGNIPFSVLVVVTLFAILPSIMNLLGMIRVLRPLHLNRIDFHGITMRGMTDILLGAPFKGIITLISGFLIYVGGSIAITYIFFNKKELDF